MPELSPGSRVLELGSGDGKTLAAMVERTWKVYALDISPEALRLSRLTLGSKADHIRANACLLPFKKDSLDAIFVFHLIGHQLLPGRKAIAFEIAKVLRSGGRLFIKEFSLDDLRAKKGEEIEPQTFQRGTGVITHYFTENEVIDIFNGLKLESIRIHRWLMRIKGKSLLRSEVEGIFLKI